MTMKIAPLFSSQFYGAIRMNRGSYPQSTKHSLADQLPENTFKIANHKPAKATHAALHSTAKS